MRRSSLKLAGRAARAAAILVVLLILSMATPVLAVPPAQEQRPVIAQPEENAVVRGVVQMVGSATHPDFQRYEIYYTPWPVAGDNAWIFVGPDAHYQQQPLGLLGTWDSRAVPDGAYALRVRVVKHDGNYHDSEPRRITVANIQEPDTPTPTVTATPEGTPTAEPTMEPTPTIIVELPGEQTAIPAAVESVISGTLSLSTSEPTPTGEPILSSGNGGGEAGRVDIGEKLNLDRLNSAARRGALYTVAAFAALGLFFGFKGLLFWLWHRARP